MIYLEDREMYARNAVKMVVLAVAAALLAACSGAAAESSSPSELESVEIRQYQGEDLSSIGEFRENSMSGPRYVSLDDYQLRITGLVDNELSLTYDQVLDRTHYSKVVTLHCVEGWQARVLWEGVLIEDLLAQAGVQDEAVVVIFRAADGYTSSLPLDYILEHDIMLAYQVNGVTLPQERGFPFQVVAESKWGYKWVKWVTALELSADAEYRGFWESRGYNNDGDVEGPTFESQW